MGRSMTATSPCLNSTSTRSARRSLVLDQVVPEQIGPLARRHGRHCQGHACQRKRPGGDHERQRRTEAVHAVTRSAHPHRRFAVRDLVWKFETDLVGRDTGRDPPAPAACINEVDLIADLRRSTRGKVDDLGRWVARATRR